MSSFLMVKKKKKTFAEKISKYSQNMQNSIYAAGDSFEKFCPKCYEGRESSEIFKELRLHKGKEQTESIRDVLQNWIDWQYDNGNLTSSVRQYTSKIKRIFSHEDVRIHTSDFDEPLEYKPKIQEELHALTVEEIQNILKYANPKKIGFYLALSCTGARPGELLQVRKKDVDTTKKRIKIRIEAENVKTRAGRSIWLTKEAGSYLMTKIKNLNFNDLVWGTNENPILAGKNEATQFSSLCDKAGYPEKYKSNNFRKITLYSFRSYFFGKASDVHREGYAHKMIGHGGYLPQYDRMSDEMKIEWFLKLEPELIIDPTKRQEFKITEQQEEITELQEKNQKIDELEKRLDKQDRRDKILLELSRLDKKLKKAIKENSDDVAEIMAENIKIENEYEKLLDD